MQRKHSLYFVIMSNRFEILGIVTLSIIAALVEFANIVLLGDFLNSIVTSDTTAESGFTKDMVKHIANIFSVTTYQLMLMSLLINALVAFFTLVIFEKSIQRVGVKLTLKCYEHVANLPIDVLSIVDKSTVTNDLTQECNRITNKVIAPLVHIFTKGVVIIVLLTGLLYLHTLESLILLLFLTLLYLSIFFAQRHQNRVIGKIVTEAGQKKIMLIYNTIETMKILRTIRDNKFFLSAFAQYANQFAFKQADLKVNQKYPRILIETFLLAIIVVLITISSNSNHNAYDFDKQVLLTFVVSFFRLMPAVQMVFSSVVQFTGNVQSLDSVYPYLLSDNKSESMPDFEDEPKNLLQLNTVQLIDIVYTQGEKKLLNNAALLAQRGDSVIITGPSGSGKSTMLNVICGFLRETTGSILINGVNVDKLGRQVLLNNVALVPQQSVMFNGTLAENIAVSFTEVDKSRVWSVLKDVELDEWCEQLEDKLDTYINATDAPLSGGQMQRLSVARALYARRNVLLLDEATSALNLDLEARILSRILEKYKDKIVILITHNEQLIPKFKKHVVLG